MAALDPPERIGVAVSGGSDSMALLHLALGWGGAALQVATVDHGLRPEAAQEAAMVASVCAARGLPHATLRWTGWRGQGNLQDQARQARLRLLGDWARAQGLGAVLLGHTGDDQAETVMLRLARGSGVDGLAGMAAQRVEACGLRWLRPLLGVSRDSLRAYLAQAGIAWSEDPGNTDLRFARVRARALLAALPDARERMNGTADRMRAAREALDHYAAREAAALGRYTRGDLLFALPGFDALPIDTRQRLLAAALCEIGAQPYRPRLAALDAALRARRATLHGCLITRSAAGLRISREPNALRGLTARPDAPWDNRWRLHAPDAGQCPPDTELRALGEAGMAILRRENWPLRQPALPYDSRLASPALWQGHRLIAAPLVENRSNWRAQPRPMRGILAKLVYSD